MCRESVLPRQIIVCRNGDYRHLLLWMAVGVVFCCIKHGGGVMSKCNAGRGSSRTCALFCCVGSCRHMWAIGERAKSCFSNVSTVFEISFFVRIVILSSAVSCCSCLESGLWTCLPMCDSRIQNPESIRTWYVVPVICHFLTQSIDWIISRES